jgi:uncharacterized protein
MNNLNLNNYNFFHQLKLLPFVQKIYLYGSRARGDSTPSSDIDIAISCSDDKNWTLIDDIINNSDTLFKLIVLI